MNSLCQVLGDLEAANIRETNVGEPLGMIVGLGRLEHSEWTNSRQGAVHSPNIRPLTSEARRLGEWLDD